MNQQPSFGNLVFATIFFPFIVIPILMFRVLRKATMTVFNWSSS